MSCYFYRPVKAFHCVHTAFSALPQTPPTCRSCLGCFPAFLSARPYLLGTVCGAFNTTPTPRPLPNPGTAALAGAAWEESQAGAFRNAGGVNGGGESPLRAEGS